MKKYVQSKKIILIVLMGFLFLNTNSLIAQQTSKWGSDIIISNQPTEDQTNAKIAVAFNGWLFSSYESNGKVYVKKSTNNGITWEYLLESNTGVSTTDMIVCGNTIEDLSVYVSGFFINTSFRNVFVAKVDISANTASEQLVYNVSLSTNVKDVKLASDYKFPGFYSNPYSVAVCFSTSNMPNDSIISIVSTDGGETFPLTNKRVIDITDKYFNKVSIAFGKNQSYVFGRYFVAYDKYDLNNDQYGNIKYAYTIGDILGNYSSPIYLDSIIGSSNTCKNPSIVCQYDTLLNEFNSTNSIPIMVVFESRYNNNNNDNDLIICKNQNPLFGTNANWGHAYFNGTFDNEIHANLSYDPVYHNFLATFFNATKKEISYKVKNISTIDNFEWQILKSKINTSNELTKPYPQVEINPVLNQAAFVWIQDGTPSLNGMAVFNAEYSMYDAIKNNEEKYFDFKIYPNPANNIVNIEIDNNEKENIYIEIISITGKILKTENIQAISKTISIDITDIPAGIYICKAFGSKNKYSQQKLIINR